MNAPAPRAAKVTPISGFPEYLPADRIVEQHFLDVIRETFELHGYPSIETRAVEPVDRLVGKGGDADKEIYAVSRLAGDEAEGPTPSWASTSTSPCPSRATCSRTRGSCPSRSGATRSRRCGAASAPGGQVPRVHPGRHRRRRRRGALAPLRGGDPARHGGDLREATDRAHDDPGEQPQDPRRVLPRDRCRRHRRDAADRGQARQGRPREGQGHARGGRTHRRPGGPVPRTRGHPHGGPRVRRAGARPRGRAPDARRGPRCARPGHHGGHGERPGALVADLKIARGLDYYTGTVYETQLEGHESWGSFCSGGRYDALASDGRTTYPGVGISIGVSRLLGLLIGKGLLAASRSTPACVLVAVNDEEGRPTSTRVATALRSRGIACEVAPKPAKFGKQIRYAERRGIPYVWFPVRPRAAATRSRTSAVASRSTRRRPPGSPRRRTSGPRSCSRTPRRGRRRDPRRGYLRAGSAGGRRPLSRSSSSASASMVRGSRARQAPWGRRRSRRSCAWAAWPSREGRTGRGRPRCR